MYRMICSMTASLVLLSTAVKAQEASVAEKLAQERTAVYVQQLGVDEHVAAEMTKLYMLAEKGVAPMRAECAAIQKKVEASLAPYDTQAETMLTKEQRAKLEQLRKEGKWVPASSSCSHAEAGKAGCSGHGATGTAAGCCAGKGAHTSK